MNMLNYAYVRLCALCACIIVQPALAAPGDIINLGTLGDSSVAYGVNEAGQVTGEFHTPTGNFGAFRFDPAGNGTGLMRNLGTLGGTNAHGSAVNRFGQVAGTSNLSGNVGQHAFRYDGTPGIDGIMHDLGTLGGTASSARGVNDLGQVVGGSAMPGNLGSHAFRYDGTPNAGGVMQDLGTLGDFYSLSNATDINHSGQISGWSEVLPTHASHAFRYDGTPGSGGVMRDLGTLGGRASYGRAINGAGQVAGDAQVANGDRHAFRYDGTPGIDGVMHDLGTLGGRDSFGKGISSAGCVVGYSEPASGSNIAALWRTDGSAVDLDAWLDSINPTWGAPWFLSEAVGITDTGMVAGTGVFNDGPGGESDGVRVFLLDASSIVPEPSVWVFAVIAAAARFGRRRW